MSDRRAYDFADTFLSAYLAGAGKSRDEIAEVIGETTGTRISAHLAKYEIRCVPRRADETAFLVVTKQAAHDNLAAFAAVRRLDVRQLAGRLLDARLPRGTILVNWVGSLLLGWFSGLALGGHAMALLGTGFCGALTTYSSFAVQTYERGPRLGAANVVLTVLPALLLCFAGFALA